MGEREDMGASAVADQALVNEAPAGLRRSGFDPSRNDTQLVEHAVRIARPRYQKSAPRWSAVMDVFAVGRTSAIELCVRFGFDPDEKRVRR